MTFGFTIFSLRDNLFLFLNTEFSLVIIDECHHTQKDGVYNKIMNQYIEVKHQNRKNLPQILGLTASPGTDGANTSNKAVDHIMQVNTALRPIKSTPTASCVPSVFFNVLGKISVLGVITIHSTRGANHCHQPEANKPLCAEGLSSSPAYLGSACAGLPLLTRNHCPRDADLHTFPGLLPFLGAHQQTRAQVT